LEEAGAAYRRAIDLARNSCERAFLQGRLEEVSAAASK
jgi:predicted RNA polymerase sigma factor